MMIDRLVWRIKFSIKALLHGVVGVNEVIINDAKKFEEKFGDKYPVIDLYLTTVLATIIQKLFLYDKEKAYEEASLIAGYIIDRLMRLERKEDNRHDLSII